MVEAIFFLKTVLSNFNFFKFLGSVQRAIKFQRYDLKTCWFVNQPSQFQSYTPARFKSTTGSWPNICFPESHSSSKHWRMFLRHDVRNVSKQHFFAERGTFLTQTWMGLKVRSLLLGFLSLGVSNKAGKFVFVKNVDRYL